MIHQNMDFPEMQTEMIRRQIRDIIRQSEINAVVREMRAGKTLRVGQMIDYQLESDGVASSLFSPTPSNSYKRHAPYRVAIEPWHLQAAIATLNGSAP